MSRGVFSARPICRSRPRAPVRRRGCAIAWRQSDSPPPTASDLIRASATAATILEPHQGVLPELIAALREIDFGDAEGVSGGSHLVADAAADGLAGGLRAWLAGLDARHEGGHVLVVSHGGPLRVMLCLLLDLPPARHWSFHLDCAGVSVVERAPSLATISLLNDCSHLRDRRDRARADGTGDGIVGRQVAARGRTVPHIAPGRSACRTV